MLSTYKIKEGFRKGNPLSISRSCVFSVISQINYINNNHINKYSLFIAPIFCFITFFYLFLLTDPFPNVKGNSQYSEVQGNFIQACMPEPLIPFIPFLFARIRFLPPLLFVLLCPGPCGEVSFSPASCLYRLNLWFTLISLFPFPL